VNVREYRLVPCSTEPGELESENGVGICKCLKKKRRQDDFIVVRSDNVCVDTRCYETTNTIEESYGVCNGELKVRDIAIAS
jgi:hypothetical protein